MATSKIFKFLLPVQYIASVNKWHIPVMRKFGKKTVPLIIKSPEARKAMDDYSEALNHYLPKETFGDRKEFTNLDITYGFYLKELFYKRDTSNAIKIFEDALARYIGFNDSQVISTHCYKRLLDYGPDKPEDAHEFIYVSITTNTRKSADLILPVGGLPDPGFIEVSEESGNGEEKKKKRTRRKKPTNEDS